MATNKKTDLVENYPYLVYTGVIGATFAGFGGTSKLYYIGPEPIAATYKPGDVALTFEDGTIQGYPCKVTTLPMGYTVILTLSEAPQEVESFWVVDGAATQTPTAAQIYTDGENPQVWATAPASDFFINLSSD